VRGAAAGSGSVTGTLVGLGVGGGVGVGGRLGVDGGVGVGGSVGPVGPAVAVTAVNTLTASELALKVIPAINALKALVVGLTASVSVLPGLEAAIVGLKAGQLELAKKVGELTGKLTETRASLKVLEYWAVAAEFAQLSKGTVGASGQVVRLGSAPPPGVGSVMMEAVVPRVVASVYVAPLLPELLASDLDGLLD